MDGMGAGMDGGARRARAERWARTKELSLEPSVVQWLVDSSGMRRAALARRLGVGTDEFERRLRTGRMTWNEVGRLARRLKRPNLAFLLGEPREAYVLKDYRGAGIAAGTGAVVTATADEPAAPAAMTPADLLAVRMARHSQEKAAEMYEDMARAGRDVKRGWCPRVLVDDPPEDVADWEMVRLEMTEADAVGRPPPVGFDRLRDALEALAGTLVFQAPLDKDSVRSVVLAPECSDGVDGGKGKGCGAGARRRPAPHVILVNAGDAEGTRTFSLLHGYGHMLLGAGDSMAGKGGAGALVYGGCVCKEDGGHRRSRPVPREKMTVDEREEEWCDSFAAAALMSNGPFSIERDWAESDTALKHGNLKWSSAVGTRVAAKALAEKFETSMYAAAVRAIDMPHTRRRERYRRLAAEVANTRGCTSHGGPARARPGKNPAAYCVSRLGREFVSLAVYAHRHRLITTHDLISYLDIRLADIDDVEDFVLRRPGTEALEDMRLADIDAVKDAS